MKVDKTLNARIAKKMKKIRKSNGLTLEQVSKVLEVSPQQVQKYEVKYTQVPFSKLFLFLEFFSISSDTFFQDLED